MNSEKKVFSLKKLIWGVILAAAGVGVLVNDISLVTVDASDSLSETLSTVGGIVLIALGVLLVVLAFFSKPKKVK